jgi:hypothetical protein
MIFARQPSNLGGGLRPLKYFRLPMVNICRPPLPPNRPYCRPLNYPKICEGF